MGSRNFNLEVSVDTPKLIMTGNDSAAALSEQRIGSVARSQHDQHTTARRAVQSYFYLTR
jgi:hypothetical protein